MTFTFRDIVEVFRVRLMLSRRGGKHGRYRQGVYIIHVYCMHSYNTSKDPTLTRPENKTKEIYLPIVILLFKQGAT